MRLRGNTRLVMLKDFFLGTYRPDLSLVVGEFKEKKGELWRVPTGIDFRGRYIGHRSENTLDGIEPGF